MIYCSECAHKVVIEIPSDDNRPRHVCHNCNTIHYENPKIITGCIIEYQNKILLCKRAIEPRHGFWTVPAGFMENGETLEEGALRESYEEAITSPQSTGLFGIYNLTTINQIYVLYKATLDEPIFSAGSESLDVQLFDEKDIPWENMAFKVVTKALKQYLSTRHDPNFIPFVDNLVVK